MEKRAGRRFGWKSLLFLALLGGYIVRFIQFNAFSPELKFNFMEEANAQIREYKPEECAWPLIKELSDRDAFNPSYDDGLWRVWPPRSAAEPFWNEAVAFENSHPETLSRLLEAASRPHLGYLLTSDTGGSNPFYMDVNYGCLGSLRSAARYLKFEMARAAHDNNPDVFVAAYEATLHLAELAVEHKTFVSQMVSIAIAMVAMDAIRDVLLEHPQLFADDQLNRLSAATRAFAGGRCRLDTTEERRCIDDLLQRMFTDDGQGDGHVCYEGMAFVERAQSGRPPSSSAWAMRFIQPIGSLGFLSRKEIAGWYTTMYNNFDADVAADPWNVNTLRHEAFAASLPKSGFARTVPIMSGAISKSFAQSVYFETNRAGVLSVIALHRYHLAHAAFPESLNELVPQYVGKLPIDPHSGKPLLYRLSAGVPFLYSVGADHDDDSGRGAKAAEDVAKSGCWAPSTPENSAPDADYVLFPLPNLEDVPAKRK